MCHLRTWCRRTEAPPLSRPTTINVSSIRIAHRPRRMTTLRMPMVCSPVVLSRCAPSPRAPGSAVACGRAGHCAPDTSTPHVATHFVPSATCACVTSPLACFVMLAPNIAETRVGLGRHRVVRDKAHMAARALANAHGDDDGGDLLPGLVLNFGPASALPCGQGPMVAAPPAAGRRRGSARSVARISRVDDLGSVPVGRSKASIPQISSRLLRPIWNKDKRPAKSALLKHCTQGANRLEIHPAPSLLFPSPLWGHGAYIHASRSPSGAIGFGVASKIKRALTTKQLADRPFHRRVVDHVVCEAPPLCRNL